MVLLVTDRAFARISLNTNYNIGIDYIVIISYNIVIF